MQVSVSCRGTTPLSPLWLVPGSHQRTPLHTIIPPAMALCVPYAAYLSVFPAGPIHAVE